jgi:hypothetical protein
VVRPSAETKARSPVEAKDTTRVRGAAAWILAKRLSSWAATPGAATVVPAGRVTTGTRGGMSPPFPYVRRIAWLVSEPSRPGTP